MAMDGMGEIGNWETILSFWGPAYFRVHLLLVFLDRIIEDSK